MIVRSEASVCQCPRIPIVKPIVLSNVMKTRNYAVVKLTNSDVQWRINALKRWTTRIQIVQPIVPKVVALTKFNVKQNLAPMDAHYPQNALPMMKPHCAQTVVTVS